MYTTRYQWVWDWRFGWILQPVTVWVPVYYAAPVVYYGYVRYY